MDSSALIRASISFKQLRNRQQKGMFADQIKDINHLIRNRRTCLDKFKTETRK